MRGIDALSAAVVGGVQMRDDPSCDRGQVRRERGCRTDGCSRGEDCVWGESHKAFRHRTSVERILGVSRDHEGRHAQSRQIRPGNAPQHTTGEKVCFHAVQDGCGLLPRHHPEHLHDVILLTEQMGKEWGWSGSSATGSDRRDVGIGPVCRDQRSCLPELRVEQRVVGSGRPAEGEGAHALRESLGEAHRHRNAVRPSDDVYLLRASG